MRKFLAAAVIGMSLVIPAKTVTAPHLTSVRPHPLVWSHKVTVRGVRLKKVTAVCFKWEGYGYQCFTNGYSVTNNYPWTDPVYSSPNPLDPLHLRVSSHSITFDMPWVLSPYLWVCNKGFLGEAAAAGVSNLLTINVKS